MNNNVFLSGSKTELENHLNAIERTIPAGPDHALAFIFEVAKALEETFGRKMLDFDIIEFTKLYERNIPFESHWLVEACLIIRALDEMGLWKIELSSSKVNEEKYWLIQAFISSTMIQNQVQEGQYCIGLSNLTGKLTLGNAFNKMFLFKQIEIWNKKIVLHYWDGNIWSPNNLDDILRALTHTNGNGYLKFFTLLDRKVEAADSTKLAKLRENYAAKHSPVIKEVPVESQTKQEKSPEKQEVSISKQNIWQKIDEVSKQNEDDLLEDLTCPVTMMIMREPVFCTLDGYTYEKEIVVKHLTEKRTAINNREPLGNKTIEEVLSKNIPVMRAIEKLKQKHPDIYKKNIYKPELDNSNQVKL